MSRIDDPIDLITPPADVPDASNADWIPLPAADPVTEYIATHHWDQTAAPTSWEVARLSRAAYGYRETDTRSAFIAKFYTEKTGEKADRYARFEFERTQQARAAGLAKGNARAVRPLASWRGVLLLEYIDGLTLEDIIAVRRSRPGTLAPGLVKAVQLLASLHRHGAELATGPDLHSPVGYAHKIVNDLARWGVLENDPVVRDGLVCSIDRWAAQKGMSQFVPTLTHGDATTTNFIYPWDGSIVAVDWERLYLADPAADLGRLMAEVSHSIKQHGGSVAEAVPHIDRLVDAYCDASTNGEDAQALLERARFYRAISTLRIARNGWVSRLDRTALVAQALALLNS